MRTTFRNITMKTWQECQRTVVRFERKHDNTQLTLSAMEKTGF